MQMEIEQFLHGVNAVDVNADDYSVGDGAPVAAGALDDYMEAAAVEEVDVDDDLLDPVSVDIEWDRDIHKRKLDHQYNCGVEDPSVNWSHISSGDSPDHARAGPPSHALNDQQEAAVSIILDSVDLQKKDSDGEVVMLLGKGGCGKSAAIHAVSHEA